VRLAPGGRSFLKVFMSNPADNSSYLLDLREKATAHLSDGVRRDLARASTSEAMAALFKLASSRSTAADALALLHELQVHQVEVDMQHDELRRSRTELESDLMRRTTLVEGAPAALVVVDEATMVFEINPEGVRLLGVDASEVLGRPLASRLSAPGGEQLHKMLALARTGAAPETFELQLAQPAGNGRKLLCSAGQERSSGRFMLVLLAPPAST